ncbi:MAG: DUF2974 domain-containing protein [Lachnospiraceae bacterium]|nr:DUF2974 domain-containing protein [Lachnospiraceae bacterium]MBR6469444.1 DUF2974 domain-containing protein [Lachnospiraceae bacterium]
MGNITDYVTEYGDKTLNELPFNEVDSLILSQFAYLKFDKPLEAADHTMTIGELKDSPEYEQLFTDTRFEKVNRGLFEAMAESRRFSNVKLFEYVNMVDAQWEIQFSAITCMFENGYIYVAYRGTDETLTGWKEDFNMAFITPIPAQTKAVQYLNRIMAGVRSEVTLGGHSKGGNLAVYAAMKCKPDFRERVRLVYSHDGPGFAEGVLDSDDFMTVKDRIRKTVPRSSIVGMVLQTQENYEVVRCRHFGVLQHDPFNWIVEGTEFKKADNIHRHTYVSDASVNRWVSNMDYEKRQEFVELLFEIVSGSGASDLNDFVADPLKMGRGMLNAIEAMDEEDKRILLNIIKEMSAAVNATIKEFMAERVADMFT